MKRVLVKRYDPRSPPRLILEPPNPPAGFLVFFPRGVNLRGDPLNLGPLAAHGFLSFFRARVAIGTPEPLRLPYNDYEGVAALLLQSGLSRFSSSGCARGGGTPRAGTPAAGISFLFRNLRGGVTPVLEPHRQGFFFPPRKPDPLGSWARPRSSFLPDGPPWVLRRSRPGDLEALSGLYTALKK